MSSSASPCALHWVLKIGNLKNSLHFLENVIGLRVLRHEEFLSGCEATCNGPYGGAWSKTMVGYGPESDNFVLELTYNYGINEYAFGNDLQYIAVAEPSALIRAAALSYPIVDGDTIVGPDNYKFKIVPRTKGRAERFVAVALRTSNLATTTSYWNGLLGLTEFPIENGSGLCSGYPSTLLGFHENQTKLQFIEVLDGNPVDHALSSGRIAFACQSVPPIYDTVSKSGNKIMTPPLTLPTPGKADVVVTILADPDGYEICFVEDIGFYQLATPIYDVIDFQERASRGGDGAPPPGSKEISLDCITFNTVADLETHLREELTQSKPVVLYFKAPWCKNCKTLTPVVEDFCREFPEIVVTPIDVDASSDVAMEYEVSSVPHFFFYRGGLAPEHRRDHYLGSDAQELRRRFHSHHGK